MSDQTAPLEGTAYQTRAGSQSDSARSESERSDVTAFRSLKGLVVADTYAVDDRIGAGGMAEVYEASHLRLGNRVAIKFLRPGDQRRPHAIARFRNEARQIAATSSEHIVRVIDCGELADGTPFLVMERLFGEDLRTLLARELRLEIPRAVRLITQACRGLCVVHDHSIVHRDLKPANLFVIPQVNGSELCKILDFGVAKLLSSDATEPGTLLGTVRYMAPEQLENAASAGAAADIYALGAILYECLAGVPAQRGKTPHELMFGIMNREPRHLSEHRDLPPGLADVVMRALSRRVSDRFENAWHFALALEPFHDAIPRESTWVPASSILEGPRSRASRKAVTSGTDLSLLILKHLVAFVADHYGEHELAPMAEAAGISVAELRAGKTWISHAQFEAMLTAARALIPDDDTFRDACAYNMNVVPGPVHTMISAASPMVAYRLGAQNMHIITQMSHFEADVVRRDFVRLTYHTTKRESRSMCLSRQGQIKFLPTLWRLPPAHIEEKSCVANGDAECLYEVTVHDVPRVLLLFVIILGGGAVGALFQFELHARVVWWWSPLALAMLGYLYELRRVRRLNERTQERLKSLYIQAVFDAAAAQRDLRAAQERDHGDSSV